MHVNIDFGEGQIDYAHYKSSRIRKQKCNTQTLSKTSGSIWGGDISKEKQAYINQFVRVFFNVECVFLCISLFCLIWPTISI